MKAKFFILNLILIALLSKVYAQNIWRVNNNPGTSAHFSTVSAAVNNPAVVSGDILLIEPSATNYTFSPSQKSLTYMGSGYFKDENAGLDVNKNPATFSSITINQGMNGSKFIGLQLTGSIAFSVSQNQTIENILFESCFIDASISINNIAANYNNFIFRKNYFGRRSISIRYGNWNNFTFENNIVSVFYTAYNFDGLKGSNNIFRNNTFSNSQSGTDLNIRIDNAYVANNIFDFNSNNTHMFVNCVVKNNLFNNMQNDLPNSATGNIFNVNPDTLFVGTGSTDGMYMLAENSPARGAGVTIGDVVNPDCGAFGATDPYRLAGISKIPTIYEFETPITVPHGQASMDVTFSTRSNN